MDAKLSSTEIEHQICFERVQRMGIPRRIIFAASFDTSEPEIFIAIPRSAFFNAGESLTPSPVLRQVRIMIGVQNGPKLTRQRHGQELGLA